MYWLCAITLRPDMTTRQPPWCMAGYSSLTWFNFIITVACLWVRSLLRQLHKNEMIFVINYWLWGANCTSSLVTSSQCKMKLLSLVSQQWQRWKPNKCKKATNRCNISHSGALEPSRLKPTTYVAGKMLEWNRYSCEGCWSLNWAELGHWHQISMPNAGKT